MQIGMPLVNARKSIGSMVTVLFLTTRKLSRISINIKVQVSRQQFFYLQIRKPERVTTCYRNWLLTYLIFSAIDIRLTNIRRLYIYHITNSRKEYCLHISYRFQMHSQAVILLAQEIGNFFHYPIGSFTLNNSMTTQHKNF